VTVNPAAARGSAVPRASRFRLSLILGIAAGIVAFVEAITVPDRPRDFSVIWLAARDVLHGQNPYAQGVFYPLPGVLLAIPFAPLSAPLASAAFTVIGVACFAWALMRHGYAPLVGCCSASLIVTAEVAQWSPVFAAATVLTPLAIVYCVKPQIGLAMFLVRPSWWPIVAGAILSVIAFAIQPTWIQDWGQALAHAHLVSDRGGFPYLAPVALPGGVFALACLLRWRRPEARLVAALACAPQGMLMYDTLPLFLVARTWRQAAVLAIASDLVQAYVNLYANVIHPNPTVALQNTQMGRAYTLLMYIPATIMVLRRQNEGAMPAWLEQRISAWPNWLRGRSSAESTA
jgi:hypothetical protein